MKRFAAAAFLGALALTAPADSYARGSQTTFAPTRLLDRLAGQWVMTGRLGSHSMTHDVNVRWILNREYIQFHEVARRNSPPYEAIVYITWSAKSKQYRCLWLDSTAAAPDFQPIGYATQAGNSIPFVTRVSATDSIHTTFAYDAGNVRWRITIDDLNHGKSSRFGDVQLLRKWARNN